MVKRVTRETKVLLASKEKEDKLVNQENLEKMGHRDLPGQKAIRERKG